MGGDVGRAHHDDVALGLGIDAGGTGAPGRNRFSGVDFGPGLSLGANAIAARTMSLDAVGAADQDLGVGQRREAMGTVALGGDLAAVVKRNRVRAVDLDPGRVRAFRRDIAAVVNHGGTTGRHQNAIGIRPEGGDIRGVGDIGVTS
jgi:hypothetical protein